MTNPSDTTSDLDAASTAYDAASQALFHASLDEFSARKKLLYEMRKAGVWTIQIGNRRYRRVLKGAVEEITVSVISEAAAEGAAP